MVNPGRKLKKILLISGITGTVYLGCKFLLPLVVPFLFAYGMALWLRPSVRYLERKLSWKFRGRRRYLPASVIGAVELTVILGVIAISMYIGVSCMLLQLERLAAAIPKGLVWLDSALTGLCRRLETQLGMRQEVLVSFVREIIRELGGTVPQISMPSIMSNSMMLLSWTVEGLVIIFLFFVSTLMFLQEMDEIRERKNSSMFHREFVLLGKRLVSVGSAWLKAEMILLLVTSVFCVLGLLLIGNPYALLIGVGIGIVDALPFIGAGVVLIPWGISLLIQKKWWSGCVLIVLYLLCYFTRQILEARLMGNHMGLTPLETLAAMYVGIKLFGFVGFLLGPIALLIIGDLVELYWNDER